MKTLPIKLLAGFVILISIFLTSCHKNDGPHSSGSSDQVPNSTGDYWKYSIQSSTGENKGYLEVRIIKTGSLADGRSVTTWVYSYPSFTDTIYKVLSNNTLEEYSIFPDITTDNFPVMRYIFPLETGMKWAINTTLASDSVEVVADTTIKVPAGSFNHSMKLDFTGSRFIGNYWNNSQYWVTSHIGIVRMNYVIYNLGPDQHNGIYELVEYRLK